MIAERIKHLRKDVLKMTQEEFAARINISRSNLGNIEVGRIVTTDRVISDIADAFSVSESWLRDGIGEMFESKTEAEEMAEFLGEALPENLDPVRANLIRLNMMLIRNLPDDILPEVEYYILEIADSIRKGKE